MAGAAGCAVFHLFHRRLVGPALRLKQVGVAFIAAEHVDVSSVRENHISGVFVFVENIAGMAGRTVAGHAKRGITVMAGAAGRAVRHRLHGGMVAVVAWLEKVRVALFATEHPDMNLVAERNLADTLGLDHNVAGVTLDAVPGHAEGLPSVVASTAGSASLHRFHADVVAVVLLFEELRVTHITPGAMHAVTEDNCSDALGLDGEFVHHPRDTSHVTHANSMQQGDRRADQQQNQY